MIAVYFFCGVVVLFAAHWFAKRRVARAIGGVHKRANDLSRITFVEYRGERLPMTVLEKIEIWDNLSRKGKNHAWSDFKKSKQLN
jgi:hypothetical protein